MPWIERVFYRRVDTGQYVTKAYAMKHPKTTVREVRRIWVKPPKKHKKK